MLKELQSTIKLLDKSKGFVSGVAVATLGVKALTSKPAKKAYAYVLSQGFKAKDGVDSVISNVKQHKDDVVADAKDIYEKDRQKAADEIVISSDK